MSNLSDLREEAKRSREEKARNMGVKIKTADMGERYGVGHTGPAEDGSIGDDPSVYADGYGNPPGKIRGTVGKSVEGPEPFEPASRKRLDRGKKYAAGGRVDGKKAKGTTVNVNIVSPSSGAAPLSAPGVMPPPAPLPVPPPPSPGLAQGAMPMPPMRKNGGRVGRAEGGSVKYPKMTFGSLSGLGRLEKVEKYGKNAKKQNPNEKE